MARGTLSQQDWTLSRKGTRDQERHDERLREVLKERLQDIVGGSDVITGRDDQKLLLPVNKNELDLPHFRHKQDAQGVGQGSGKSKIGDVVGNEPGDQPGGQTAGGEPGIDWYETEVTIGDILGLVFELLELPNLEQKSQPVIEVESVVFQDIRRHGIMSNLDKRRTIKENIKRNAVKGDPRFKDIRSEDLRFKTWDDRPRRESNAVILAMMDVSGSMGDFQKFVARTFFAWTVRFLRRKYVSVEIVFIAHHTEAKEVSEKQFFSLGESGGTRISSAYTLAQEIIATRYAPSDWNIYPIHISDGENSIDDIQTSVELVETLLPLSSLVVYGQVRQDIFASKGMLEIYRNRIDNPKFRWVKISEAGDILPALMKVFSPRESLIKT